MIYLLGIDHKIQYDGIFGPKQKYIKAFVEALTQMINELSIEVVVEEFNEDAKRWNHVTEGVVERVAAAQSVKLIFCEPDKEERKRNGILTEPEIFKKLGIDLQADLTKEQRAAVDGELLKQFLVREALWYDTIKDDLEPNVLCVIGARHVSTFGDLLKRKGHEHEVLSENWCLESFG